VGLDGIGGRAFFSGTGAADLELDPTLTATTVGAAAGAGGLLDGSAASRVSQLDNDSAGATARYRAFIVGMGVEVQASSRRTLIQTDVTEAVDSAREGAAGVNLDEEMIAMVALQHAYNASARFLTAIDEVLSTLVERTGRVGA
jgi:flagellar hook-associated protein 1 FlgK